MAFDDCASCGSKWCASHRADCQHAADRFLDNLASDHLWTTSDEYPRCPKCGHGTDDWHEFMPRYGGDGDLMHVTCEHCDHEYDAEVVVSYSFRIRRDADTPESENG